MVRVLHVNDVARIGSALVSQARSAGLDWSLYDTARVDPQWSPRTRGLRRALRGAAWEAGLARRAVAADLLDIHGATVTAHTRWLRRPYVLHLHGTDIRVRRYEAAYASLVEGAVREAHDVYYTTPDLAEHVLDLAPEATLQPVIVDVTEIPVSDAPPGVRRVVFPSRWDSSKGGDLQLRVLGALRSAFGKDLRLEGLDWGTNASRAAREFDVLIHPRMTHASYASWMASGTAAVGQMTGVLGVSELEAVATGVPVVVPLRPQWYDGRHETTTDVPVLAGPVDAEDAVDAVVEGVRAALAGTVIPGARQWVERHHSPARAVERLLNRPAFSAPTGSRSR